jgi:hypothetical protein
MNEIELKTRIRAARNAGKNDKKLLAKLHVVRERQAVKQARLVQRLQKKLEELFHVGFVSGPHWKQIAGDHDEYALSTLKVSTEIKAIHTPEDCPDVLDYPRVVVRVYFDKQFATIFFDPREVVSLFPSGLRTEDEPIVQITFEDHPALLVAGRFNELFLHLQIQLDGNAHANLSN